MSVGQKINADGKQDDPCSSSIPRYVTVITHSSPAWEPRPPPPCTPQAEGGRGDPETPAERARLLASRFTVLSTRSEVISAPTNERMMMVF